MFPISMPNQNQNQNNQASCGEQIQAWWQTVPFFNKLIMSTVIVMFILNAFSSTSILYMYLSDIPVKTLKSFQLWRLISAWIIHRDVLDLLFCAISFFPEALRLEKQCGSIAFFFDFLLKNIEIQIIFLFLSFIFSFIYVPFSVQISAGLWDMVMLYITIRSASNPEQETPFLCFPVLIKQKYYPFLIILLFSMISQAPVSLISAMLVGYMEAYLFNGMLIRLSRTKAIWFEEKIFKLFKNRPDFISASSMELPYYSNDRNYSGNASSGLEAFGIRRNNNSSSNNNNQNNYLAGRGVALGSGPIQNQTGNNNNLAINNNNNNNKDIVKKNESSEKNAFGGKGVQIGGGNTSTNNSFEISGTAHTEIKIKEGDEQKYISLKNEKEEKKEDNSSLI